MTPEEFDHAIIDLTPAEFAKAVASLDEKERKALAKVVKARDKQHKKERESLVGVSITELLYRKRKEKYYGEQNVVLATYACGSARDIERADTWYLEQDGARELAKILIDRSPHWLSGWVDRQLDKEFHSLHWDMVRSLYKAGAIDKPTSDGYTEMFVNAYRGYDYQNPETYVPTSERLLAEPEFLEDEVWRLFTTETSALAIDWEANYRQAPAHYETWPVALVNLANDGHLDRNRLLDESLGAMQLEFKQNQLSAYGKLHLALKPDEAEMLARQDRYLALLVSPTSLVVSFAIKILVKLSKSKDFDARAFMESARPVFAHKQKGMATQILKAAALRCQTNDGLTDAGLDLAIAAMAHASPDVQALALDLVESLIESASEAQKEQIERQAQFVSPKLSSRAAALSSGSDAIEETPPLQDTAEISAAVEGLPGAIRSFAGLAAEPLSSMPAAPQYSATCIPAMDDRPRLERLESTAALVEHAAHLVEGCDNENDIELLLDGIARFGSDRGGDFEKLAAPLLHRMQQGELSSYSIASGWTGISVVLIDLLRSWLEWKNYDSRRGRYYSESPRDSFVVNRLKEIQAVMLRGKSGQLLATPSWADGGWIDPLDLVERIDEYEQAKDSVFGYDLMQALLRLAPVNRAEALRKAATLQEEVGAIVRFALGGDDRPGRWARKLTPMWVCAARARDPFGSVRELLGPIAKKVPDFPDILEPAQLSYRIATTMEGHANFRRELTRVVVDGGYTIAVKEEPQDTYFKRLEREAHRVKWGEWPTAGLLARVKSTYRDGYEFSAPWRMRWFATTWPQNPESYFRSAVIYLDFRMDMDSSRDEPLHYYLSALFDPIRPWGNIAVLALSMGLISKSTDTRGFATDALIPAIETGQADVDAVAKAFATLFGDSRYKLNRFGEVMPQVLEISPLHRWWVAALVDRIVCRLEKPPKNVYFLYEVALDAMLPIGARPSEALADILRGHKGSSKTAKLAKELLALDGKPIDEPADAVIAEAWALRLAFAERFTR